MTDSLDSALISSETKKRTRKASPKFKYPLVAVIWDDAESDPTWTTEPLQPLGPTIATTVGFLIRNEPEEDRLLVADSYIDDVHNTISGTTKIPKGMIKDIIILIKDGYKKAKDWN